MFSAQVIKEIKYYVYLLSDPTTNEVFYVGKGKGNRVFQHLKDKSDNPKTRKIKELEILGLKPKMDLLIHGCDELTVKKVEASIIDLIGKDNLTNIVKGYESTNFGRMNVSQISGKYNNKKANIIEKVLLVKLSDTFRYNMSPHDLYDITRGIWKVSKERQKVLTHAFAVYDGIIQETYKIEAWFDPDKTYTGINTDKWKKNGRYEFVGNICNEMRRKYLLKSVAHYYPLRAQNPVRYTF